MWLKQLPLFRRAKLPPPFFVSLAIDLEVHLFAPLEVIIESHSHADSLYVVEKGIVLCKGLVKTQGDVFGEDAISAFRCARCRSRPACSTEPEDLEGDARHRTARGAGRVQRLGHLATTSVLCL